MTDYILIILTFGNTRTRDNCNGFIVAEVLGYYNETGPTKKHRSLPLLNIWSCHD